MRWCLLLTQSGHGCGPAWVRRTAQFSIQKCDSLLIPDLVLGAGEAMRRREFITVLVGTAVSWPLVARAQQAERVRRIGVLMARTANDPEGQKQAAALQGASRNWDGHPVATSKSNIVGLPEMRAGRRRSLRSCSTGDPTSSWPIQRRLWSPRDRRPAPSPSFLLRLAIPWPKASCKVWPVPAATSLVSEPKSPPWGLSGCSC